MKKAENIIAIAVPCAFAIIATVDKLWIIQGLAGLMTVAVVGLYAFQWFTKDK